jgi:hypothetical protein
MTAFRAPEEPHLAFICSPQLTEPPEGKIMLAFRAFDLDGGHGVDFYVFIIDDSDLIGYERFHGLLLVLYFKFTDIAAFPAFELTSRRDHHCLTFRTEHRYSMSEQRRLILLSGTPARPGFYYGRKPPHYLLAGAVLKKSAFIGSKKQKRFCLSSPHERS